MTPDELNALPDEALIKRIDAVVDSRGSTESAQPISHGGLAEYITLKLLNRMHTHLEGVELHGKTAKVKLLAWVAMDLTFVTPPPDVHDVETFGDRIRQFLKRQFSEKKAAIQKNCRKPAEKALRLAELDACCCWLTGRPSYIEVYAGPFPEPGSAVPTPTPATRPAGHVPFARSRLPESSTPMEAQETLQDLLQSAFEKGESKGESKAAMASARADAALNRVSEAEAQAREAEAQAREAEAGRQRVEVQNSKLKAAAAASKEKLKEGAVALRHAAGQVATLQQQVVRAHADAQGLAEQARAIQVEVCKADAKRSAEQQAQREAKLRRLQDSKAQAELAAMRATAVALAALQREKRLACERVAAQERKAAAKELGRRLFLESMLGGALQEEATLKQQLEAERRRVEAAQQQVEAAEATRAAQQ